MADHDATSRASTSTSRPSTGSAAPAAADATSIGEVIELVKEYARQETVGPLRGAARWLAAGLVGAIFLAMGAAFVVLGVLRLLQHEFAPTFRGPWMTLVPYLVALVTTVLVIVIAISRIGKKSLQKDPK
jgi:uncharacterized membrane protein